MVSVIIVTDIYCFSVLSDKQFSDNSTVQFLFPRAVFEIVVHPVIYFSILEIQLRVSHEFL